MGNTFQARLDRLPASQKQLWPELDAVPDHFVLYGGTAIALQLGHRVSEDFDFFSSKGFDPDQLRTQLPFFRDLDVSNSTVWVHRKQDNVEAFLERGGGTVKVAFFGGLNTLKRIEEPLHPEGSQVQVASLLDMAGMKMRVIQVRGNWKDYVDIHALVKSGIDIETGLAAGLAIDSGFDPRLSVRALQYYGDGTAGRVPEDMQRDLTKWALAIDLARLPRLYGREELSPGGIGR